MPWTALAELGIQFCRGDTVLICAGSGTGKSAFTLSYVLKSKSSALYFSGDSNSFTQSSRAISIMTGRPLKESKRIVRENQLEEVRKDLEGMPIRFDFDANPSLDDIELSMESYDEVYGEYPDIVVIDNLTNIRADISDENRSAGLEGVMDWINGMARDTQSCVIVLHHVTQKYNDGLDPIPLSGVKDQIHRVPAMVLTLHKPGDSTLCVSPVKNRNGEPDTSGNKFATLYFEGDRMNLEDI